MSALAIVLTLAAFRSSGAEGSPIPSDAKQLLLVHAPTWAAASGTLERYERDVKGGWIAVGPAVPVDLGRAGLAWGRGLHVTPAEGPRKTEGDGKSPAGVFALERAFGVAPELPSDARGFPYLATDSSTYCVEDARSAHYNQIVRESEVRRTSWEKWSVLKRPDGLFDWGLIVAQNRSETVRGAGSCVFLHIWRGPRVPTSGCTAMAREQIETVLRWLDASKKPVLVQLPDEQVARLRGSWALP